MRRNRFFLSCLAALAAVMAPALALAQGGETHGHTTWWMPQNVSTYGGELDMMFDVILYLTVFINIAVFVVMIWFLIRYRYQPGRTATFIHGNNRLEAVWTLIPTIILALIAVLSQSTWARIKMTQSMPTGKDVVEMEVVGRQFQWFFHYPGKDGKLAPRKFELINRSGSPEEQIGLDRNDPAGKDDLVTTVMVIPVNRKVYVHLTSTDVLHSFFLPNFRVKQDAMPGLNARVWLEATKTSAEVMGTFDPEQASALEKRLGNSKPFDLVCAELCGQGHYKMRGMLYVVPDDQYEAFLAKEAEKLAPAGEAEY